MKFKDKFIKLVVVNKNDLYNFERYVDWLLTESQAHDVKVIEDFSELKAENISDEIVENTQDTMSILENYVNDSTSKVLPIKILKAYLVKVSRQSLKIF